MNQGELLQALHLPEAYHPADPPVPDISGKHRAEPVPSLAYGLVAHIDTMLALAAAL